MIEDWQMGWEMKRWENFCTGCKMVKAWYYFPTKKGKVISGLCCVCFQKQDLRGAKADLNVLIIKAMRNKMPDLRNHLFECLEMIKSKEMNIEEAKAACMVAQTIINSAKVELDFIKAVGIKKLEFMGLENSTTE